MRSGSSAIRCGLPRCRRRSSTTRAFSPTMDASTRRGTSPCKSSANAKPFRRNCAAWTATGSAPRRTCSSRSTPPPPSPRRRSCRPRRCFGSIPSNIRPNPVDTCRQTSSSTSIMAYLRRVASLLVLVLAAHVLLAQSPQTPIATAIVAAREAAATEEKSNPSWKDLGPDLKARLTSAQEQLDAGRLYLAVDELSRAQVQLGAGNFAGRAPAEGMAGFTAAWQKAATEMKGRPQTVAATANVPALVRPIEESGLARWQTLFQASRAYADVTNAEAGFFYLGEGEANRALARTVAGYGFPAAGTPFVARSIAPELASLQARVNDAFRPPLAQEKHP